jgi:hypothetical protein
MSRKISSLFARGGNPYFYNQGYDYIIGEHLIKFNEWFSQKEYKKCIDDIIKTKLSHPKISVMAHLVLKGLTYDKFYCKYYKQEVKRFMRKTKKIQIVINHYTIPPITNIILEYIGRIP